MNIFRSYKVHGTEEKSLNGGVVKIFQYWRPLDKEGYSMNYFSLGIDHESIYEQYALVQPDYTCSRKIYATQYYPEWWSNSVYIEAPTRVSLFI